LETTLEITHDGRVFHYTHQGKFDFDGINEMAQQRYSDPRYEHALITLLDFTDMDLSQLKIQNMQTSASNIAKLRIKHNDTRARIWVAHNSLQFGMLRMRESLEDSKHTADIQVFGSMEKAQNWIQEYLKTKK